MSHVRPILAFLIVPAVLALAAPAAGQILFQSMGLNQPSPLEIEEGYEAGWDLQLTVSFTIPAGAGAFELWLHAYVPADLPHKADIGYSGCGFDANRMSGEDWLVAVDAWRTSPGGLITGSGFAGETGNNPEDVDVNFTLALGTVCDDAAIEEREGFTIEVVVDTDVRDHADAAGLQRGASISRSFLINDDDSFLPVPANLVLAPDGADMRFSWDAPAGDFTPALTYEAEHRADNAAGWTAIGSVDSTLSRTFTAAAGRTYRARVRSVQGSTTSAWAYAGPVTVTPGPVNQPPVVAAVLPAIELGIGQVHTVILDGAFTDPEGDPLSYTDPKSTRPDVANVSGVAVGTFTVTAVLPGSTTVTISATDGHSGPGRPAVQSFVVTVLPQPVNQPPVPCTGGGGDDATCLVLEDLELSIGETVNVSLVTAFTDPEGDPLTYGVESSSAAVLLVNPPAPGEETFPIRAIGAGTSTVTVTATDGQAGPGRPAVQQFDVVVAQAAPPRVEDVSATLDPAGNAVSVSWTVLGNRWAVESYVLAGEQVSTEEDRWTRELSVTGPPARFRDLPAGAYRFRVRAVNAVGEGAWSTWVDVTVEAAPPVLVAFHSWNIGPPDELNCRRDPGGFHTSGQMTLRLSRPAELDIFVSAWQTALGPGSIFLIDAGRPGQSPAGGSLFFKAGRQEATFDVQPECSVLEGERYGFEILSVSARPAYGQEIPVGFSVEIDPDHGEIVAVIGMQAVSALPPAGLAVLAVLLAAGGVRRRGAGRSFTDVSRRR